ncbi:hypothetical protein ABPG72_008819 [Tetrahymena utriculariae]
MFYLSDITVPGVHYGKRVEIYNALMQNQSFLETVENIGAYASVFNLNIDQYGTQLLSNTNFGQQQFACQRYYQVCNVFDQSYTPSKSFPIRSYILFMNYWAKWCNITYGSAFPDTIASNKYFSGLDIQATNLIFTNGDEDPWQQASKKTRSTCIKSYVADCHQCARYVELEAPCSNDSQALKDIRAKVLLNFSNWKKEFYDKQTFSHGFIEFKLSQY